MLKRAEGVRRLSTELKYKVMDDEVRMEIARLYKDGWKVGDIADAVGLH